MEASDLRAQDLEIVEGSRQYVAKGLIRDGKVYYSLKDLASVFSLELEEVGSEMRVTGERARLTLLDDRPLVRMSNEYMLLSTGVWRRRGNDWYVPPDFVEKALPGIINQRISMLADGRLRIERLGSNRVRVETSSHPDHLSIVFRSSEAAPVEVREFQDYLEVVFGGYLVRPEVIETVSERGVVESIRFVPEEGYGSFRLRKGPNYKSFRHFELGSPPRLVLDIYSTEVASAADVPRTSEIEQQSGSGAESDSITDAGVSGPPARIRPVVVIDPGHGGEDYGVDVFLDELEKGIVLNVSRQVQELLQRAGAEVHSTRFRDVSLPTEQRSAIGNFYRGDLFLGIHVGGSPSPSLHGPVVYTFGPPDGRDRPDEEGEGLVPPDERALRFVPWDEAQMDYLASSRQIARQLQNSLNLLFSTENEPVSAPLDVLASISGPAVFVEIGFLTNPEDRELLRTPEFQERIVQALVTGLQPFLDAEDER